MPLTGIVGPQVVLDGKAEDRPEQPHDARRGSCPACHAREPMLAGLDASRCLALGHVGLEALDVELALTDGNLERADERLDVAFNGALSVASVDSFLGDLAAPSGAGRPLRRRDSHRTAARRSRPFDPAAFSPAGSPPRLTSVSRSLALSRAASGVQGEPCLPIVCHRCRPSCVR